jgi:glycosyl hydrolase family 42 (putative beta-galactosidase)/cellulase (glycosyl hydrolase family 5)
MSFTISDGRLLRDGRPFVAVGVDYHPSEAGCRIWTDWDPIALKRDFTAIRAAGCNTVRLFVFWRDFEPEPGRYRENALSRLREAVAGAADAGLACVISLFTIWMNGQRLDLAWRRGRSLWRDEEMLARQEEFARSVGATLRGQPNVLAFDLGDEIANVDPVAAAGLSRGEVASWHRRMATVLRRESPGVLVVQAGDTSGVFGATPFGVDNARELDMIAIHGFPTWAPGSIESTASYKATCLVPFLTRFAGAYGVPFVDELGSYGTDEHIAKGYLRAAAASALAGGAAGVLAWCWQDVASSAEPYEQRPNERHAGLRRLDGTAKPALTEFQRVARAAGELAGFRRGAARVGLYVPERERADGGSYLDGGTGTLATFYAYLLLKRAHLDADIVTGELGEYELVICPSVTHVTLTDLDRLCAFVEGGGVLYYSVGDHLHGFPGSELSGVRIVDYSLLPDGRTSIRWDADEWPVDWGVGPARPLTIAATAALPVACYPDGTPAVLVNRVGRGRVVFCGAPYERQLDRPGRLTTGGWERLYRRVATLAGVSPAIDCADPEIEIVPDDPAEPRRAVVINHGSSTAEFELVWRDAAVPVRLDAKDWRIVHREATR